jgi:hypothetical protein
VNQKTFESAIHKASIDATRMMGAHLRTQARKSNWPDEVVRGMGVGYKKGQGFSAHVHESHKAKALDLEYGTPGNSPTATIRRFANRTNEAEKFISKRLFKYVEKSL